MKAITPYLNFHGNAAEALLFYKKAFGGEVLFQQTYGDAQLPDTAEEMKDYILHAHFQSGELNIMVSDTSVNDDLISGTQTHLSLDFDSAEKLDNCFNALSEDAKITMALQDTFWGARFGMLTDKFGVSWMFNHDYEKK